jgi:5,10-methylenetetrahydromethanopterin reductase
MTAQTRQKDLGLALPMRDSIGFRRSLELAQEAERLGYRSLWTGEVSGLDAFTVLAAYATVTTGVHLGTAVIAIQTRTPVMTAMSFASLHAFSGGRALMGLGVGSPIIAERWHGVPYPPPLAAMREAVTITRQVLRGERTDFAGTYYRTKGFQLSVSLPKDKPVPLYLAALNRPMLRLAGELADGVLFNYSPAEAIAPMIAEVRKGAEAAGRDPNMIDYAMYVRCCVTDEVPAAVQAYKRELSSYGFVEPYVRMFTRYGFGDDIQGFRKLWQEGRRDEAVQCISDTMVHTLAAIGPKEKAKAYINACRQAGLTHPIVFPIGAPRNAPVELPRTIQELVDV